MLLNVITHLSFYFLEEFLKKYWKNLRDNFSKFLKSRERNSRSRAEASTWPKCKLFTQTLFLKDSILNRPTTSNVISNSLSVSSLLRSNPRSSSPPSTRNESVKRGDTTLLTKRVIHLVRTQNFTNVCISGGKTCCARTKVNVCKFINGGIILTFDTHTYAKVSEKLIFLTSRKCAYQGVRHVRFPDNSAYSLNEWSLKGFVRTSDPNALQNFDETLVKIMVSNLL